MTIEERIKKLRKEKGFSQEQSANYLSLSRQAIAKREKNVCEPNIESLSTMASLFGVSLDYLLKGDISEECQKSNLSDKHQTLLADKKDIVLLIAILISLLAFIGLFIYALINPLYRNQTYSFIWWYIQIFNLSGIWFRLLVVLSLFVNIFSLIIFIKRKKVK